MSCLKCGQEVSPGQVFCESCLSDMARHPVKPGTPVIIPKRNKPLPTKRTHKRVHKPEDIIVSQRRLIGWLLAAVIALMLASAALTVAMFHYKDAAEQNQTSVAENVSRETIFDKL